MKRVVLDTNVTISAFFWKGPPRSVFDLARTGKITMLVSKDMEIEFIRVLGYSKFGVSPKEIVPFMKSLRSRAELVEVQTKLSIIQADPTDNVFLECAVDGKADYIISGDKHLLDMGTYSGIAILKAKDFLVKEGYLSESNPS
ncbi:MAG: putative toxin-antitoxin system toxin component, PIN family [Nitrospirae bacterium]|nr:putative toxin-antitoxin system toxin component, PIN family [Nitrospirota bacterium]